MQQELKWFAARAIRDRAYVLRCLQREGIQTSFISDLRSLVFVRCTLAQARRLKNELWNRLLFYRGPDTKDPQPIPDQAMETFLIMAPSHEEPLIYLAVDDPALFEGPRKRITRGIFAGCEGVIKRLKGQRRLIVKISDRAAIATPYIPQEFLEEVGEEQDNSSGRETECRGGNPFSDEFGASIN